MAAQVGKFAAQKLLNKQMKNYQGKKVETGDARPPSSPSAARPLPTQPPTN
jgi:hypothetical protein